MWEYISLFSTLLFLYFLYVMWQKQRERDRVQERIASATEDLATQKWREEERRKRE